MATDDRPIFPGLSDHPAGIGAIIRDRAGKYSMLMTFAQEILREDSHLPAADRELIAAFTSTLNGCRYCHCSHAAFAGSLGASADDLETAESGDPTGHRLEPLLAYVKKLTLAPSEIAESDRRAVIAAGFTDDELKDAIAVCAAFNLFNRLVEGHGIAPRDNYDSDVAMINAHGYDRRR
ncbi:MAG: carboxymuconolactone decarboxylase family protein [Actinomycetota bacterium]